MRKSYLVLLFVAMFAITSCDYNDEQLVVNPTEQAEEAIINGKVPFSRAISNADFVFKNIDGSSAKKRKVRSVDVLTKSNPNSKIVSTRSSSLSEDDKPLAYVVNYENNEGFAILAADTKLPPVISIGDEGNFDTEGFANFVQNNGATRSDSDLNPAQEVQYGIINNSLMIPSIDIDDYVTGVDTTIMLKCLPLVPTKWGQGWPYNCCSFNAEGDLSSTGCVPLAGAQTLVSLCYHHNWRPTTQLSNTYTIDWYIINRMLFAGKFKFTNEKETDDEVIAVASLIRAIGEDINADYDIRYPNVVADNINLCNTFNKLGLKDIVFTRNNDSIPITQSHLFDMIVNKNYPIPTQANKSNSIGFGHSFIIDGWLRLEYSVLTYLMVEEAPGIIGRKPDNLQFSFDLVHVNFGEGGDLDGYYLPGAFDSSRDEFRDYAEENDLKNSSGNVYNMNVEYLIYDMP